jgi:hypothetical protein
VASVRRRSISAIELPTRTWSDAVDARGAGPALCSRALDLLAALVLEVFGQFVENTSQRLVELTHAAAHRIAMGEAGFVPALGSGSRRLARSLLRSGG